MRPLLWAAAAAIVVAGVTAVWVRWLARRQRHWSRALAERIPVNSAYWRERRGRPGELLYVAIGDSAAQGIGASRPERGYVGQLAARIRAERGIDVRVVNLGISGATLRWAIDFELPPLARLEPDLVTVSIGANDIATFDEARFAEQLGVVLDALPPHAIVADLPSFYFLPAEKKVRRANALLRKACAARGLAVVDLHRRTRRQGIRGMTTQFAGDLFHPNDRGYAVWADAFADAALARVDTVLAARDGQGQESGSPASSDRSQSRASTNTESE